MMPAKILVVASVVGSVVVLDGCATFSTTKKLDMTPFAENTTAMIGEIAAQSRPPPWLYLRKHQDRPSVQAVREAARPLRSLLRGVGLYSMQVVGLHESRLPEKKKVEELSRYVVEVVRPNVAAGELEELGITLEELDTIAGEIRAKETFLDALAAAQPLVNSAMVAGNKMLDAMSDRIEAASADIGALVEGQFAPLKDNLVELERAQMRATRSFALIARLRLGEEGALEALLENEPELGAQLKGKPPTPAAIDAAERRVFERLQRLEAVRNQLLPEISLYKETQRELDGLRSASEEQARWARATLAIWARSHRNLGAGISVPPTIDLLGLVGKSASSAAGKVF